MAKYITLPWSIPIIPSTSNDPVDLPTANYTNYDMFALRTKLIPYLPKNFYPVLYNTYDQNRLVKTIRFVSLDLLSSSKNMIDAEVEIPEGDLYRITTIVNQLIEKDNKYVILFDANKGWRQGGIYLPSWWLRLIGPFITFDVYDIYWDQGYLYIDLSDSSDYMSEYNFLLDRFQNSLLSFYAQGISVFNEAPGPILASNRPLRLIVSPKIEYLPITSSSLNNVVNTAGLTAVPPPLSTLTEIKNRTDPDLVLDAGIDEEDRIIITEANEVDFNAPNYLLDDAELVTEQSEDLPLSEQDIITGDEPEETISQFLDIHKAPDITYFSNRDMNQDDDIYSHIMRELGFSEKYIEWIELYESRNKNIDSYLRFKMSVDNPSPFMGHAQDDNDNYELYKYGELLQGYDALDSIPMSYLNQLTNLWPIKIHTTTPPYVISSTFEFGVPLSWWITMSYIQDQTFIILGGNWLQEELNSDIALILLTLANYVDSDKKYRLLSSGLLYIPIDNIDELSNFLFLWQAGYTLVDKWKISTYAETKWIKAQEQISGDFIAFTYELESEILYVIAILQE